MKKPLEELFSRIDNVCKSNSLSYEIWFVDDGSTDFRGALLRI
jgi:glycosyltransferase involved in cell wall biosynthesis